MSTTGGQSTSPVVSVVPIPRGHAGLLPLASRIRIPNTDPAADHNFGVSLACADLAGDERNEVVVGANLGPYFAVFALVGTGTVNFVDTALGIGNFGDSMAALGDIHADGGKEEIAVSLPGDVSNGGRVLLYGSALLPIVGLMASPDEGGNDFGDFVVGRFDFNGDGVSDVAVGAPGQGTATQGAVFVYTGRPDESFPFFDFLDSDVGPDDPDGSMGARLVAGDLNGDGKADLVVGAPDVGPTFDDGALYVIFGGTTAKIDDQIDAPLGSGGGLGSSIAILDADGDGLKELAAAANGADTVYLVPAPFGQAAFDGASTRTGETDSGFGRPVVAADLNRDGHDDLLVGARYWSGSTGQVQLFLGGPAGLDESPAWVTTGLLTTASFGQDILTCDVNADDAPDVIVSSPADFNPNEEAAIFLGPPVSGPRVWAGAPTVGVVGTSVAFVGATVDDSSASPPRCVWSWGDGTADQDVPCESPGTDHVYGSPGVFTVRLRVENDFGVYGEAATFAIIEGIAP